MAVTRIGVLGPLHISIDGQRVPPGAPMQCAVLGRLVAAGGRVVPTERLIDDLWHGDPPTKAVAALQVYIHNLRRVFEPDRPRRARSRVIVSESHGYALNLEPEQVDAWHFEQLLHGHEATMRDPAGRPDPIEQCRVLDAALACWHGTAFESFAGMPWAAQEAARLMALGLTAAELRAQAALEMNRPAEVVLALRPIFEEYPGREECARLLAVAQYRLGQSLDALATVRHSREFLTLEFGVDPGPGLRDLEHAILTHSVDTEAPVVSVPIPVEIRRPEPAHTPDPVPDTGYAAQRAALLAAAEGAAAGQARLVWLAGEAGAGKTTLAASITGQLAERSWTTVFGRCPEVEGAPPAWAWAEVLTGLDAADPETFTAADAFTLARRVVRSCRERSADAPIVIVLEDVHGADTATLQVLRQVVNWLRDRPILIIATLRGSEAAPGVRDTAAALALFTADRIELDGLDLAGTRRAAMAAGLTEVDDRTVALLRRRTGGNPLFVRELAKLVASQGTTDGLPDSVRDLLGRRIAALPAPVIELLREMSVWGEDTDITTLAASAGHTPDTVIDLIATAETARLLRAERSGRITFDHALVREAVYYDIPLLRRTRMHWSAFEFLCRTMGDTTPVATDPAGTPPGSDRVVAALRGADEVAAATGTAPSNVSSGRNQIVAALRGADEVAADPFEPATAASDTAAPSPDGASTAPAGWHPLGGLDMVAGDPNGPRSASLSSPAGWHTLGEPDTVAGDPNGPRSASLSTIDAVIPPDEPEAVRQQAHAPAVARRTGEAVGISVRGRDIDAMAHHAALGADAGTAVVALRFVRAAAWRCVERRMRADAVRRWRSVLALHDMAGHTAATAERADRIALLEARCELVTALAYDGQHFAARAAREQALDLAESLGGTTLLAQAATCWPTPLIWSVHDWHTPDPRIREPLRIALADPELPLTTRIRVQVTRVFDRALDDPAGARAAADLAVELAEPLGDPDLLCTAVNAQAFADFAARGFLRAHELRGHAGRLLRLATEAGLDEFRALAHYLLFRATLADADLTAAAEHARCAGEYATDGQLRHLLDAIAPFGMVLELLRGNTDEVLRLLDRGSRDAAGIVAHSEEGAAEPSRNPDALHIGVAISLGWLRNDLSPFAEDLRERVALKPELFVFGYALSLVHAGQPDTARQVLAAAPPIAPQFWSTFTGVRARLAITLNEPEDARAIYADLLPYAGTVCGLETGASSLGPMDEILAELADYLGDPGRAAVHREAAQRLRERLREDLTRLTAGPVLIDAGQLGPAGRARLIRRL
ncbi:BTAD domain-containing putative transcriptional regulator [Nocardia sp. NPDC088792]|uniref:BTAD domain-containing putative transcriptional regulator n=1 Tax=Nocardia sp. NPDC088792 TaxID=3364332 RepID=UPI00382CFF20